MCGRQARRNNIAGFQIAIVARCFYPIIWVSVPIEEHCANLLRNTLHVLEGYFRR